MRKEKNDKGEMRKDEKFDQKTGNIENDARKEGKLLKEENRDGNKEKRKDKLRKKNKEKKKKWRRKLKEKKTETKEKGNRK